MNIALGAKALALTIPALTAAVGGTVAATNTVEAHFMPLTKAERQEVREERREDAEAVKSALEANDFAAFQAISEERPGLADITAEQFAVMVEAHTLMEAGDHEAARALMEDAGLQVPGPFGRGGMRKVFTQEEREAMKADMEAVHAALESRDYAAYTEATADREFMNEVTEEQFMILADAHELREAGDFEGAKELLTEAGLEGAGPGGKFGRHMERMEHSADEVVTE